MQQLIKRFILFLSLAATAGIPNKGYATHLAGSDISYTCVGGNSYRVELTFYRDCSSPSQHPNGVGIEFRSASCNMFFTDTMLLVNGSGQEISYPCPGLTTSCDDPNSTNPGIQEYKYSKVINFPMQCSDWIISWTYCCRNCDITTMVVPQPCVPGTNPPMYISTTLDNLNYTCNSSPHFTNIPIVFICVGQNFTYNHGAVDPDGDSLAYSLVNPMISPTDSIPFIAPYSATNPVSSSPAVFIDPLTGDIIINPTQQEVGVLSVLVEEFRNGVRIGYVVRDMEIYVRQCNNTIPFATGMNGSSIRDTVVCPDTQICFDVFSGDTDTGQIVTMTWNQQIAGATFNVSGFPYPTGNFCWTPTVNDISTVPHQFTVTVVDNACPNSGYQSYAFTILVNSPLVNRIVTNISCNGLSDGSINVVPVNPGGFSYLWSPGGQTTSGISNLSAGAYSVTVYDSTTGCSGTFTDTILNPPPLTDTAFAITATCTGSNSGEALAIASGGTPPYSYSWNTAPPTLNDTLSNVPAGIYAVTITDSRGCTITDSVNVNSSSTALIISVDSVSTLFCYTDTNGVAMISVSGGTPAYSISWNTTPVQTGPVATGLGPGTYIVTITDSLGCSATDSATVLSPPPIVMIGGSDSASCGNSDGIAFVTVSGGVPGYTYAWTGFPSTDDSLVNVPPGFYTVTVTDSNSCEASLGILVVSETVLSTASAIAPVGCENDSNAIAVATATGGTPPYSFSWNTVPPQINDTATGLPAGFYIVTITDSTGCFTVDTVNIPNPAPINISVSSSNASCSGDSTGTSTLTVNGGVPPYMYSWSPYGGNGAVADSLIPGVYTVTVSDAAGCVIVLTDTIFQDVIIAVVVDSIVEPTCNGSNNGSVDISVTGGSGSYTYSWTPGGYTTEDISNIVSGIYIVTVTDQNNCSQQQQVNVNQPQPVPVDAGVDTAICAGSSIQLLALQLDPGSTGIWSSNTVPDSLFSDVNDPNSMLYNVPPASHALTWTVTDSNGCTGSDMMNLFNFNLTAGSDFIQCGLNPVQMNATILPGLTGLWTASSNVIFDNPNLNNAIVNFVTYGVDTLLWTVSGTACNTSDSAV
jgi:SprB repeat